MGHPRKNMENISAKGDLNSGDNSYNVFAEEGCCFLPLSEEFV